MGPGPARASDDGPGAGGGRGQSGARGVDRRSPGAVPGQGLPHPRRPSPTVSAGFASTPSKTRSSSRTARPWACAWAGWAIRASPICATLPPTSRFPPGPIPMAKRGRTVTIAAPFGLGRYPVTNGQYRAFIDDGGYGDRQWWSDAGWTWLQREGVTEPSVVARPAVERVQPAGGRASASGRPRPFAPGPADGCRASRSGRPPPAAPRASRIPGATTGRMGSATAPRPASASPRRSGCSPRSRQARLGIEDLAGNVWEWCSNAYDDPDNTAPPKDPEAGRVLRGGSWFDGREDPALGLPRQGRSRRPGQRLGFRVARTF